MTSERRAEDVLREEYFSLLPTLKKTLYEFETKIMHSLIHTMKGLRDYERIDIRSRIKECESSIYALRMRQEGRAFYGFPYKRYSLVELKDLVGVRVLVFPKELIGRVDTLLLEAFPEWESDPVLSEDLTRSPLALKYYGRRNGWNHYGEYQIVSMLVGLFWEVEHDAIYKPSPNLKGIEPYMEKATQTVYRSLLEFENQFGRVVEKSAKLGPDSSARTAK